MNEPLALTDQFKYSLTQLEGKEENHLLILGKAGTGKSTLLRIFRNTTEKKVVFLAPTGIAALHISGQTIHSFFRLPPKLLTDKDVLSKRRQSIYRNFDILVIDEISMVRADVLDAIDLMLRHQRNDPRPFGGVRTAFFGDIFQLPPVVSSIQEREYFSNYYEGPYFFNSKVWQALPHVEPIELDTVFRQSQRRFINLLDQMRQNRLDYDDLEMLNSRVTENPPEKNIITLSPRRSTVQAINMKKLQMLDGEPRQYSAEIKGQVNIRQIPTLEHLILKPGAQVIFVKNDPDKRFVNGSIGEIRSLGYDSIEVEVFYKDESSLIELEKQSWEVLRYNLGPKPKMELTTEVIGTFTQFPIKLAWAMTIHKSQGKTFDQIILDLGRGAFESGQSYVALSRCRTLEGIFLKQPIRPRDIILDEKIVDFYLSLR